MPHPDCTHPRKAGIARSLDVPHVVGKRLGYETLSTAVRLRAWGVKSCVIPPRAEASVRQPERREVRPVMRELPQTAQATITTDRSGTA